jgi:hypothetical protein
MEYQDTASSFDHKFTFCETELGAIKAGLKTKLYVEDGELCVRQAKWKALLDGLCSAFDIPAVGLEFQSGPEAAKPGFGGYCSSSKTITIGSRFSLVTLLHFFAVALLDAKREDADFIQMIRNTGFMDPQELAAAFSLSLFREAAPKMYEAAKLSGKLMFFQQMEAAGHERSERGSAFEAEEDPEPAPRKRVDIDPENRPGWKDDGKNDD